MQAQQTPIKFTGKGGEYFGIWIVNLLLSIVTLGVYSAWAKVRRMKYFYNNTKIDGVGFDYHAKPLSILKGRIIAFVIFIIYAVLAKLSGVLGGLLLLTLFILTPWIIVRSMIFNARNSSHRGLRFDFTGKTMEAAKVYILYPILIIITLGLAFPFVMQRTNKFLFENHQFGTSNFKSEASAKDFYMVYLKLFGVFLALGVVFALLVPKLLGDMMPPSVSLNQSPTYQSQHLQHSTIHAGFIKVSKSANAGDTKDEDDSEVALQDTTPMDMYKHMGQAMMAEYGVGLIMLLILLPFLLYGLAIAAMTAYVKSRISNLIWNNTTLESIGFVSNMRMRDLVWLYLTNGLAIIFSLGLATPWVQIRMARYKAEHLALTGETDWDKFVGEKKESAKALGGEMAEMFDMDISFG